jgi:hypothetical protein
MVLRRIRGDGVPRMPPLATYARDLDAEALITAWINGDPAASQTYAQWQMIHFTSTTDPDADPEADPDGDGQINRMEFLQRTDPKVPQVAEWPTVTVVGEDLEVRFLHPAVRPGLIETSIDLQTWEAWNAAGNTLTSPLEDQMRILVAPRDGEIRFFRLRLEDM